MIVPKYNWFNQRLQKWYLLSLRPTPDNKSKSGGNSLALKKAQFIPCTLVLYDKEGKNQRAGCLRFMYNRFQLAHLEP